MLSLALFHAASDYLQTSLVQGYQFEDDELYGDDDDAFGNDGELLSPS